MTRESPNKCILGQMNLFNMLKSCLCYLSICQCKFFKCRFSCTAMILDMTMRNKKGLKLFLGIKFIINNNRTVTINMTAYLEEVFDQFPEDISQSVGTAATSSLFEVDHKSPLLDKEKNDGFRSLVIKFLWLTKSGRPDIEVTLSCLYTRVADTIDDWFKLKILMRFLHATKNDERIIGINDILNSSHIST